MFVFFYIGHKKKAMILHSFVFPDTDEYLYLWVFKGVQTNIWLYNGCYVCGQAGIPFKSSLRPLSSLKDPQLLNVGKKNHSNFIKHWLQQCLSVPIPLLKVHCKPQVRSTIVLHSSQRNPALLLATWWQLWVTVLALTSFLLEPTKRDKGIFLI